MPTPIPTDLEAEIIRCQASPIYFAWHYCTIKVKRKNLPFKMWDAQTAALDVIWKERFTILLKARQIGMTTLVVAYVTWLGLFKSNSTILLFSKGTREAKDLIRRIKSTITALPTWLQPTGFAADAKQELELPNGTRFISFGSRGPGGDSYCANCCVIDEADIIPTLGELLEGAEPTIADDGQMIILSRVDKKKQDSAFKSLYRAARKKENDYKPLFIPWHAAPWRTPAWYEAQKRSILSRDGNLDDLFAQYPATDDEALAPRETDRRFTPAAVLSCYKPRDPLTLEALAGIPAPLLNMVKIGLLRIYDWPQPGRAYLIGADVAAGNPNSDDSVACVVERAYQRQVAVLQAKVEPDEHAQWIARLAKWYREAAVMVERNHSYGESCINALLNMPPSIAPRPRMLVGRDNKYGWWTDHQGKRQMYAHVAASFRAGSCVIVDQQTYDQILSLDVDNLEAPADKHDDCAMAFAIAVHACSTPTRAPKITVLEFDRNAKVEAEPDDEGDDDEEEDEDDESATDGMPVVDDDDDDGNTTVGCVEVIYFDSYSEWWIRVTRDDVPLDLDHFTDRSAAIKAATIANKMLEASGRVSPPSTEPGIGMYQKLIRQGWIR